MVPVEAFVVLLFLGHTDRAHFHFLSIFNRCTAFFSFAHLQGRGRLVIIKATFFCVQLTIRGEEEEEAPRASGHICGRFMVDALITMARLR